MTIGNYGTISANMPFTDEAKETIKDILDHDDDFCIKGNDIEFDDYYSSDLDGELIEIVKALEPAGYILNGIIKYYGDYEGKIYIENNKVKSLDATETGLYEADASVLIESLKKKGRYVEAMDVVKASIIDSIGEFRGDIRNDFVVFSVCSGYFYGVTASYCEDHNIDVDLDSNFDDITEFDSAHFVVDKKWLYNHIHNDCEIPDPEAYLRDDYTSDDSIEWYEAAVGAGMIFAVTF